MKKLIPVIMLMLVSLSQEAYSAGPEILLDNPLPVLPPNQEVVMVEITVPPGAAPGDSRSGHTHDAYVYVYMVEGTLDMQVQGQEVKRVSAGDVFVEMPGDIHLQGTNPSATEPARFIAFMIKTQGAPLGRPVSLDEHDEHDEH